MKLSYTAKKLSRKTTKVVVRELLAIQRKQSVVTPHSVVRTASNPKSPLNKLFEWNDGKAADKYRLWQARQLIASVFVVNVDDKKAIPVRAFVNVSPEEDDIDFVAGQGYVATRSIRGRRSYENQVLEYAQQQLIQWRTRFGGFKKFFRVVKAIDEIN